jgi:hypothetical protein
MGGRGIECSVQWRRGSSISQPVSMKKYSPGIAIFNRGAILPDPCISACRARFLVSGLRTIRTSHPSGSTTAIDCIAGPGSLWLPQKNIGSVSRPKLGYRSMVTELVGPTLAWLAIRAIACCTGGGGQRPIRSGGSTSNPRAGSLAPP